MNELPEVLDLGSEDEARRLWDAALAARVEAPDDLISLCNSIDLGAHAVEIMVISRLQPHKDQFPATIGALLETPSPEVDKHRDAIHVPNSLQFTDIIDLLSEEELECVSPGLHRGWEDRRFSCRRSRETAQSAIKLTISTADRDSLLLLSAYRNRVFRYSPPVRIVPGEILGAFDSLVPVMEGLLVG